MRAILAVLAATVGCGGGGSTVDGGDPCAAVTCQNGGTCSSHQGSATCACAPAAVWGGPTCTLAIGAEVTEVRVSGSTVAGEPLSMSAALLDPGELATGVVWTLGDGEMLTDSALSRNGDTATSTVEHTYTTAGAYTVTAAASAPVVSVGSKAITVAAPLGSCGKTSWMVTTPGFQYAFDDVAGNPAIVACRGQTMTFHLVNVDGEHPFCIWNGDDPTDAPGVTNNCATGTADIVWAVPTSLPNGARYRCSVHLFGNTFVIR